MITLCDLAKSTADENVIKEHRFLNGAGNILSHTPTTSLTMSAEGSERMSDNCEAGTARAVDPVAHTDALHGQQPHGELRWRRSRTVCRGTPPEDLLRRLAPVIPGSAGHLNISLSLPFSIAEGLG